MDDNIYDFENHMLNGVMTEKSTTKIMYDIRKIEKQVKKLGRPLTKEEIKQFICN